MAHKARPQQVRAELSALVTVLMAPVPVPQDLRPRLPAGANLALTARPVARPEQERQVSFHILSTLGILNHSHVLSSTIVLLGVDANANPGVQSSPPLSLHLRKKIDTPSSQERETGADCLPYVHHAD